MKEPTCHPELKQKILFVLTRSGEQGVDEEFIREISEPYFKKNYWPGHERLFRGFSYPLFHDFGKVGILDRKNKYMKLPRKQIEKTIATW